MYNKSPICLNDINEVNSSIIKSRYAAAKLSDGNLDPVFSYSSDCPQHGITKLYELLALKFWRFQNPTIGSWKRVYTRNW